MTNNVFQRQHCPMKTHSFYNIPVVCRSGQPAKGRTELCHCVRGHEQGMQLSQIFCLLASGRTNQQDFRDHAISGINQTKLTITIPTYFVFSDLK